MIDQLETRLLKAILYQTANNQQQNELVQANLQDAIQNIPDATFTEEKYQYLFKVAKTYYAKYSRILSRPNLQQILDSNPLDEEAKARYRMALDSLQGAQAEAADYAYLKDKVLEGYNKQLRIDAITQYADLVKAGKPEAADKVMADMLEAVKPKEATKRISFTSATELAKKNIPPVKWIVNAILPEGLTLLSAPEKSGKSAFVMQMGNGCVGEGKPFLGQATTQGKVLYFDMEQGDRINMERLAKQGLGLSENFKILDEDCWDNDFRVDEKGIDTLRKLVKENVGTVLVILDTWGIVRPPTNKETKFMDAYQRTLYEARPIKKLARELHISIMIITHLRKTSKPSEDHTNDVTGGLGTGATADRSLQLHKTRNSADGWLKGGGRVGEDFEWCMKFDKNTVTWSSEGNAVDVRKGELRTQIQAVLKKDNRTLSVDEISGGLQLDFGYTSATLPSGFRMTLSRMLEAGEISSPSRGKYTLPIAEALAMDALLEQEVGGINEAL